MDIGPIGPLPNLYDPAWFPEKLPAAFAEAWQSSPAGPGKRGGEMTRLSHNWQATAINRRSIAMSSEPRTGAQGREAGEAHSGTRGRLSRRPLMAGLAAVAAAGLLAACSSGNGPVAAAGPASNGQQQDAGATTISTRMVTGVGMVLTDQSGKTLYSPRQEGHGVIKCTGSCLSFWFPVTVSSPAKPGADRALDGALGSIQRSDDHSRQLTYNGKPLYTFRLDDGPGQAHGNNFTDQFGGETFNWQAVTSSGTAATPSQPSNPSSYNPYQGSAGY